MHCRLCVLGGRKGRFSPLTSALRHYRRNACPSRRLPTPGRCQSVPNATSRIQLQLCDVRSRCASPPYSTDAHAAPNLGQIEKINDMFDAVGLGADMHAGVPFYGAAAETSGVPSIKAPLLIHYAENDERINAMWPAFETALNVAGVPHEMHKYPGTQPRFH